ncbi:catechol 1,2-dioxygenase [Pseudomonas sp. SDO5271_S396]
MSIKLSHTVDVQNFLEETSGLKNNTGNPRLKQVINRLLNDLVKTIEDLEITDEELWKAVAYINQLGTRQEAALLVAGLGLEHYLDLLSDARDELAGMTGGTPRTIEGPLYVAGAPICEAEARMDDGTDAGTRMFLHGRVLDESGQPIPGAIVDIWHANTKGGYSHFDPSQSSFNLRRRIIADHEGRYRAHSILPSGYGCPADGPTQALLDSIGRHGNRPAHIHFFISAPGCRHLTTQINLAGDKYLWDDFAYATREGLVCDVNFNDETAGSGKRSAEIQFDFLLQPARSAAQEVIGNRDRAES